MSQGIIQNSSTEGIIQGLYLERYQDWIERTMSKKQTWLGKVGIVANAKIKAYEFLFKTHLKRDLN